MAGPQHLRALAGMVVVTLLWSTAGVVTRQLESARSFEATFWRSAVTCLTLAVYLLMAHRRGAIPSIRWRDPALWLSGLMWAVMFTCFMVALTLTSVANVLITMSVAPLVTAVLARFMLGQPVATRTWGVIVSAGAGIAWMYAHSLSADPKAVIGTAVALGVPIAAAINWNTLQRSGGAVDLVPALLVGALVSSFVALPFALPLQASPTDVAWLAGLGVFQLALPCVIAVRLARLLPAPEIALLALLEIIFGIGWAWWGAGEAPAADVLIGGAIVLASLTFDQLWIYRSGASR